jgi:2,4-dienoyl-CoA reductase-like NADH-dependent reductase (Old Yellow Enzyme family)
VTRAVGGVGAVIVEATGVTPEGRISPGDTGIWSDEQTAAFARIVAEIKRHGAVAGIQIAHAGRKASTAAPWVEGGRQLRLDEGGWETLAPSALPFEPTERPPRAMTHDDIKACVTAFRTAASNALAAGFQLLEVHAAHGYLLHEFLSPLSNARTDEYGGAFENRVRLLLEVVRAVREVWPEELPLLVRISAEDWAQHATTPFPPGTESWTLEQSVRLSRLLREEGVDLIDTSSGALVPGIRYPVGPAWQTPLAARIKAEAGIAVGAVGSITEPAQAEEIVASGQADVVLLARELLRNPYWALRAAAELGVEVEWPVQYQRGALRPAPKKPEDGGAAGGAAAAPESGLRR